MLRPLLTTLALGWAAPALAQDAEVSGFTGTQILNSQHELYTQDNLHRPVIPSLVLGGRGSVYPLPFAGVELDAFAMPSATGGSAQGGGGVLLYGTALQVSAGPGLGNARAPLQPFVAFGPSILGVAGSLGSDADLGFRGSLGAKYHLQDRMRLRVELTNDWASRFGPAGAPAAHFGLRAGVAFKVGKWPPPGTKELVIELLNAYEDHATPEDLAQLAPRDELVAALAAVANDPDVPPSRRGRAVTGLAELPPEPETAVVLEKIFSNTEEAPYLRRKAMLSLADTYPEEGKVAIDAALASDDLQMEWAAIHFLDHKTKSEFDDEGAVEADQKIEDDVPHVTFVMLDPDGNELDATRFTITDRFGQTTDHVGGARFIDPRYTGEEEWDVSAADGSCLSVTTTGAKTGEAAGTLSVSLEPKRDEEVSFDIRDEEGNPIPGAKVTFKEGPDFCAPKDSVDANAPQSVGPGTYQVFVEAEGYMLQQQEITVAAGEPIVLAAALPATAITIGKDKIATEEIHFDTGTATLKSTANAPLDELAAAMLAYEIFPIKIEGHTDNVGNPATNLTLSQARSDAVKAYLVSKGINPDWLIAEGFGDTLPISSNNTEAGRSDNRRVDFVIGNEEEAPEETPETPEEAPEP